MIRKGAEILLILKNIKADIIKRKPALREELVVTLKCVIIITV